MTAMMKTCVKCGGNLKSAVYVHEVTVGGHKVSNGGQMAPKCVSCGEQYISAKALGRLELVAAQLVLFERRDRVNGAVVRYARKAMGLRQTDLARMLGVRAETISEWETKTDSVSVATALALHDLVSRSLSGAPLEPKASSNDNVLRVEAMKKAI
jgi:DNA-binding transcriptional regulator YiaG